MWRWKNDWFSFSLLLHIQLTTKHVLPGKFPEYLKIVEVMSIWPRAIYVLMLLTLPTNSPSPTLLLHAFTMIAYQISYWKSLRHLLPTAELRSAYSLIAIIYRYAAILLVLDFFSIDLVRNLIHGKTIFQPSFFFNQFDYASNIFTFCTF